MAWLPKVVVAGQALGSSGFFGAYTGITVGASVKTLIPAGAGYVICDAHTSVQFTTDGGSTFATVVAASAGGFVVSDGINVYVVGDGTGGTASYTLIN